MLSLSTDAVRCLLPCDTSTKTQRRNEEKHMKYSYNTKGTCSTRIDFDLDGEIVTNVHFTGGCNGNTQGVAALVDGLTVSEIEKRLKGIQCGMRGTSCVDQLATAVQEALEKSRTPQD